MMYGSICAILHYLYTFRLKLTVFYVVVSQLFDDNSRFIGTKVAVFPLIAATHHMFFFFSCFYATPHSIPSKGTNQERNRHVRVCSETIVC